MSDITLKMIEALRQVRSTGQLAVHGNTRSAIQSRGLIEQERYADSNGVPCWRVRLTDDGVAALVRHEAQSQDTVTVLGTSSTDGRPTLTTMREQTRPEITEDEPTADDAVVRSFRVACAPTGDYPDGREWIVTAKTSGDAQQHVCAENNLTWSHIHAGLVTTTEIVKTKTELEHGGRCGVRSPWHSGCVRFADECDGITHWDIADQPEHIWTTPQEPAGNAPTVAIHTVGELHIVTHPPKIEGRVTVTYNLSDLLDDPAHKPDADLVRLDGTDHRMQDFVFFSEGALDLYEDMVRTIERQLSRGKSVVVVLACRGGKHRSVAFGENLASHFEVTATHHHRTLPVMPKTTPAPMWLPAL